VILPISSAVPFAVAATAAESAVGARAEETVLRLLYQLIAVLLATRIVVFLVRRVGQTPVSGEILAGLLLGPSCLGALVPDSMESLLHSSTSTIFVGIAQIGLVLLMFQIGLEFEFQASLAARKRSVVAISAMGLLMPFILGFATATFFATPLIRRLMRGQELGAPESQLAAA
jgi:Kef-type K+ transport system membrane component KefB